MSKLIQCEVCKEWCHGLPDGSPRCLLHLPGPPRDATPRSSAALSLAKETKEARPGKA